MCEEDVVLRNVGYWSENKLILEVWANRNGSVGLLAPPPTNPPEIPGPPPPHRTTPASRATQNAGGECVERSGDGGGGGGCYNALMARARTRRAECRRRGACRHRRRPSVRSLRAGGEAPSVRPGSIFTTAHRTTTNRGGLPAPRRPHTSRVVLTVDVKTTSRLTELTDDDGVIDDRDLYTNPV